MIDLAKTIEGYYPEPELEFLYLLIEQVALRPQAVRMVELGVLYGRSSVLFLDAAQRYFNTSVVLVDPWLADPVTGKSDANCKERFWAMVEHRFPYTPFVFMEEKSVDAEVLFNGWVDLLHVDDDRTELALRLNCQTWCRRVRPPGYIVFHDWDDPEFRWIPGIVREYAEKFEWSQVIGTPDNMGAFQVKEYIDDV